MEESEQWPIHYDALGTEWKRSYGVLTKLRQCNRLELCNKKNLWSHQILTEISIRILGTKINPRDEINYIDSRFNQNFWNQLKVIKNRLKMVDLNRICGNIFTFSIYFEFFN